MSRSKEGCGLDPADLLCDADSSVLSAMHACVVSLSPPSNPETWTVSWKSPEPLTLGHVALIQPALPLAQTVIPTAWGCGRSYNEITNVKFLEANMHSAWRLPLFSPSTTPTRALDSFKSCAQRVPSARPQRAGGGLLFSCTAPFSSMSCFLDAPH